MKTNALQRGGTDRSITHRSGIGGDRADSFPSLILGRMWRYKESREDDRAIRRHPHLASASDSFSWLNRSPVGILVAHRVLQDAPTGRDTALLVYALQALLCEMMGRSSMHCSLSIRAISENRLSRTNDGAFLEGLTARVLVIAATNGNSSSSCRAYSSRTLQTKHRSCTAEISGGERDSVLEGYASQVFRPQRSVLRL